MVFTLMLEAHQIDAIMPALALLQSTAQSAMQSIQQQAGQQIAAAQPKPPESAPAADPQQVMP